MVERGGVLYGDRHQDTILIRRIEALPNASTRLFQYRLRADILEKHIESNGFLGLYHTHWLSPFPSRQDVRTGRRLAQKYQRPFILAIRWFGYWRGYEFDPGTEAFHSVRLQFAGSD